MVRLATIGADKEGAVADLRVWILVGAEHRAQLVILFNPLHQSLAIIPSKNCRPEFVRLAVGDEDELRIGVAQLANGALFSCPVKEARRRDLFAQRIAPPAEEIE